MAREFDELNAPEKYNRSVPFDIYFGEMDITEEQKEKRIAVAEELDELMLFLFALIATMLENDSLDMNYVLIQVNQKYLHIVSKYFDVDEYTENYIRQFSSTFLQTTIDNIEDAWYLSNDRATFISENESNNVVSHDEYVKAVKSGKTKKQWITMRDKRVRHTHREVDGKIKDISEPFVVGDSLMNFARDTSLYASPQEIVACRCSTKYF